MRRKTRANSSLTSLNTNNLQFDWIKKECLATLFREITNIHLQFPRFVHESLQGIKDKRLRNGEAIIHRENLHHRWIFRSFFGKIRVETRPGFQVTGTVDEFPRATPPNFVVYFPIFRKSNATFAVAIQFERARANCVSYQLRIADLVNGSYSEGRAGGRGNKWASGNLEDAFRRTGRDRSFLSPRLRFEVRLIKN